jgi:hypothetical protein
LSIAQPATSVLDTSIDHAERITRFINSYDGGDCFFITPLNVTADTVTIEGYGNSVAAFEKLDGEFRRQNGFEARIAVHVVTTAQCAAVNFLSRMQRQHRPALRLDFSIIPMRVGSMLTGAVADFGNQNVELLLVANDGFVYNLTGRLKATGDTKSFSIAMMQIDSGRAQPQLLLAVSGSKRLQAIPTPLGSADQVFAQLLTEAPEQTLNTTVKYVELKK